MSAVRQGTGAARGGGIPSAIDSARAWFFSGSWGAACAWGAIALVLAATLVWFFMLSPYGAPAAPVYAEF